MKSSGDGENARSRTDDSSRLPYAKKGAGLYEQLRSALVTGVHPSGTRLSESLLAEFYGVSRTPIREALLRLEQDDLVERLGSVVRTRVRSEQQVLDIYAARGMIEGALAFDAARRRLDADIAALEKKVDDCSAARLNDGPALVRANEGFHDALGMASHNRALRDLQSRLTAQVAHLSVTTLLYPKRWGQAVKEHALILAAIANRDGDTAQSLACQHMENARDIRIKLLRS